MPGRNDLGAALAASGVSGKSGMMSSSSSSSSNSGKTESNIYLSEVRCLECLKYTT